MIYHYYVFQPMVMNLACVTLRMTMPEALIAATLNAAAALGKSDRFGSIEKGKVADFVIINASRYVRIIKYVIYAQELTC